MGFKSGFVGVLGKTNVGKSTLINALLGQKALIVSDKPQTTRNRIRCVLNRDDAQVVFVDTPGLHKPVDKLSRYLIQQALAALDGLDLVLYLIEPWIAVQPHDRRVFASLQRLRVPRFLIINKVDLAQGNAVIETIARHAELKLFDEIVPLSSRTGHNLETLKALVLARLPEGAPYFGTDQQTDRPLEFLCAELIREQVFGLVHQEVPYAVAVEVSHIRERAGRRPDGRGLVEVGAYIDVAHDSQRGILIGRGGSMVKRIGQRARASIEAILGAQVHLELKVRVVKNWNEDPAKIRKLLGTDG